MLYSNDINNTSQNDWLSATKAIGFSHNDPNRHTNNASGFPFLQSSIGGNGPAYSTQNDWLSATKANGFSRLVHGGRSFTPSSVSGDGSINSTFQPRGSSISTKGAGSVIRDNKNNTGKVLTTQFEPRGSAIDASTQIKGSGKAEIPTVFRKGHLWTSNYNLPKVRGPAIMYGNATLGLNTDLGVNVQPKRQAFFTTGL